MVERNSLIKAGAMVGGGLGFAGIAIGVASRSVAGVPAVIIGVVAIGIALKTLVDVRRMERDANV